MLTCLWSAHGAARPKVLVQIRVEYHVHVLWAYPRRLQLGEQLSLQVPSECGDRPRVRGMAPMAPLPQGYSPARRPCRGAWPRGARPSLVPPLLVRVRF
jgi:hypothetical protein